MSYFPPLELEKKTRMLACLLACLHFYFIDWFIYWVIPGGYPLGVMGKNGLYQNKGPGSSALAQPCFGKPCAQMLYPTQKHPQKQWSSHPRQPPSLGGIILPPVSSNLGDKSALQQTWQPSLDTRDDKTTVWMRPESSRHVSLWIEAKWCEIG